MTRSIFDPTGDETERGRSQFLGPAPTEHSKMPPAAVDGKDEAREDEPDEQAAQNEASNRAADDDVT